MGRPRLGRTSKDRSVQPSVGRGASVRLSGTLSNRILKTSSDGDSTASLGTLLQRMIVLTVKSFFLVSR